MQAVLLAGGKGSRLRPFTNHLPKPLIPIEGTPIIEILLRQLKFYGFTEVILTLNHMSELIMAFFGDGSKLGLKIRYTIEDKPLGTAGPISLIEDLDDNFIVANGDLLTTMNFKKFFDYHVEKKCAATIGAYEKKTTLEFGVLGVKDEELVDYIEKPTYTNLIGMGICMVSKKAAEKIPKNEFYTIPDLLLAEKACGNKVNCYIDDYFWLDIGRQEDYENACRIFAEDKTRFVPDWEK